MPYTADAPDVLFRVSADGWERLKVTRLKAEEGVSRLFDARLRLCSDDSEIALGSMVGKPACVAIESIHGTGYINGIVSRFDRRGEDSRLTHYSARIVPAHWLLTRRIRSRIFQQHNCSDMTVPGIIKKVLLDAGVPSDRFRFALQGTYVAREYVV